MWRANIIISFGKYAGQSFKWLLENDIGYVVWLLDQFQQSGDSKKKKKEEGGKKEEAGDDQQLINFTGPNSQPLYCQG